MNAERLHAIVDVLKQEITETRYPEHLKGLFTGLDGAAKTPEDRTWQRQIDSEQAALRAALGNSVTKDFSPLWKREVQAMHIEGLLGSSLLDQIEDILNADDKAPAVMAAEMGELRNAVQKFVGAVQRAASSLDFLRIGRERLNPGDFEVGFMIPRTRVANGLKNLGTEFVELRQIFGPFSELAGKSRPEIEVRTISSSEFQILLVAAPPVAASIAFALDKLASTYERIVHIRLMKKELTEKEIPEDVLDPLASYSDDLVEAAIEKIADQLIAKSDFVDEARLNELRTDLHKQLAALALRVERGYNVEVRTGELPAPDAKDQLDALTMEAAESVLEAQEGIRSINAVEKPIPRLEQPEGPERDSD